MNRIVADSTEPVYNAYSNPLKFGRLLDFINPMYHLRRVREDLSLMVKALRNRRVYEDVHNRESLAKVFRGRLFTAFMLSGPSAIIGIALAFWVQKATDNNWLSLVCTVLFIAAITNSAYQIIWWLENKAIYRRRGHLGFDGWVAMQRDLWPVHFFGLKTGFTFAALTVPIAAFILGIAEFLSRSVARNIPVPIIVLMLDAILVQGPFLRLMGDFFDRHSQVLADRYEPVLCDAIVG